jgi:acyl-coenzyme A thioesterase PaaI-like protein
VSASSVDSHGDRPARARYASVAIPIGAEERRRLALQLNDMDVVKRLGFEVDLSDDVLVKVHVRKIEPFHLGGMRASAMNCATVAALLDCAIAITGMAHFPGRACGTVDLSLKVMWPIFGDDVSAVGVAMRTSEHLVFAGAELFDGASRLCAVATGIATASTKPQTVTW